MCPGQSMAPSASYAAASIPQEQSAAGPAKMGQATAKSGDTPSAARQPPRGTVDTTDNEPASNGVHHTPIDTERFLSEQVRPEAVAVRVMWHHPHLIPGMAS